MSSIFRYLGKYKLSIVMYLVLVLIPFVFNVFALWVDAGSITFQELLNGSYTCWWGFECNPLPEIIRTLFIFSLLLSLFTQLPVFLASAFSRSKFPKLIKSIFVLLIVLGTSAVVRSVSGDLMPSIWLSSLYNYNFGFPVSHYAMTYSWSIVFPTVVILLLLSVYIRIHEIDNLHQNRHDEFDTVS